jgi:hypothetical protein
MFKRVIWFIGVKCLGVIIIAIIIGKKINLVIG